MLRRVIEYLSCVKVCQCTVISALIDPSLQTFGGKIKLHSFPLLISRLQLHMYLCHPTKICYLRQIKLFAGCGTKV